MNRSVRIWPIVVATLIGVAILCYLGTWQLLRLQWKEGLIAQLAANEAAAPVDLATAESFLAIGNNVEFMKVQFRATYLHGAGKTMISTFDGGPGWTIITPAITTDGRAVIVDRGRVPGQRLESFDKPAGEVEITGVVRTYRNGQGFFDPNNDTIKNAWYWWDIPAMLKATDWKRSVSPVLFVVQILPGTVAAEFPKPAEPRANLRNNHLGYAITWYGLALVLAVMAAIFIRVQMRKSTA
jgi:surfeit locus 1 family protein